jgi:hypothetical protein
MYGTLIYNGAAVGVNASNFDLSAATDPDFTQKNGHYLLTENYRLGAAMLIGANVTRGRFQIPTFNAYGEWNLFNANRALTPPSNPQWDLYYAAAPVLPQMEEIQVQSSNNLGAATEQENVILQLLPDDWNTNLPRSPINMIMKHRASFTLTPTINVWSGPQALTFSAAQRGGTYAVIGCKVQGANAVAWRLIFPRSRLYHGRKLRPGGAVQTAIGDVVAQVIPTGWTYDGVLGLYHTFEPVQIEVFGATAAATTYQVFLDLVWLDKTPAPLDQWVAAGM